MYLSHIAVIDHINMPDTIQSSMGGIEEGVCINVMFRLDPFGLKNPPQCFGNVEMRRIRWEEKDIEPTLFPFFKYFLHPATPMDAGIVENYESGSGDGYGKVVNELRHILRLYTMSARKPVVDAGPGYHAEVDIIRYFLTLSNLLRTL